MRRRHSPSPGAETGLANGPAVCNLRRLAPWSLSCCHSLTPACLQSSGIPRSCPRSLLHYTILSCFVFLGVSQTDPLHGLIVSKTVPHLRDLGD